MEIIVDRSKVYDYAMSLTAQAGKSAGMTETVSITPDNFPMLDVYMSHAVASIESVFKHHLGASNLFDIRSEQESLTITLKDRIRPNPATRNVVESCIRLSIALYIAGMWLQTTLKEISQIYLEDSRSQALSALSAFVSRSLVELTEINYSANSEDTETIAGNDDGNADYSAGIKDDESVNPCWKYLDVHACDDVNI